jgi:DNA-binding XRE family transcriptional regulator
MTLDNDHVVTPESAERAADSLVAASKGEVKITKALLLEAAGVIRATLGIIEKDEERNALLALERSKASEAQQIAQMIAHGFKLINTGLGAMPREEDTGLKVEE